MADAIDRSTFDGLVETTGEEFVGELVDTFLTEAPAMLDDMRDALANGDADRFRRAAHSLKSNANTFGALTLGALAKALELGGIDHARDAGGKRIDEASAEYARAASALKDLTRA
ncbi:MAG TPA: Hpt domain-containing protein [Gemmatimonadaceae bacterium]|nr:Hpt domain-containing protein [Casimicrobiaceae bacterium]